MLYRTHPIHGNILPLIGLVLLVAGCESRDQTQDADRDAAKANVEAMAREHENDTTEASEGAD